MIALLIALLVCPEVVLPGHVPLAKSAKYHFVAHGTKPDSTFDTSECRRLMNKAEAYSNVGQYQTAYDTVRYYLTLCHDDWMALGEFDAADGDNDGRGNPARAYPEFREWLKSVLYLRTDSMWYCRDVQGIIKCFNYFEGHGIYPNGAIAVIRYLVSHNKCGARFLYDGESGAVAFRNKIWRDTVKDSLTEARPDTNIPSIDSIGLSILRGPQYASAVGPQKYGEPRISTLRATENPFTRATEIVFDLADYGLVEFKLFDALGNVVTSNGIGQVLEPGQHTFEIDGSKLPAGAYFARIAYHNRDVKSVMLVKE
ncbi:MAG: hypothetical protein Q8922_08975 [Bacteroidota bacterium]|nr:hypothetical protein [Bacteroidota bacterium]MDP4234304.1 hypothetical protein [Bacteroidota bacterium]MDP4243238.1 hypothetical protein [Bacteroidota bacterium]MDP4288055.1 hypothetical protein [Bacteroidota bacterium]